MARGDDDSSVRGGELRAETNDAAQRQLQGSEVMAEAEVSLRLAIYLIAHDLVRGDVAVNLDGAHEAVRGVVIFNVDAFMERQGWTRRNEDGRRFRSANHPRSDIKVTARSGVGDVAATLQTGKRLVVEAKGGSLVRVKGNPEYKRTREALGQLLTIEHADDSVLVVAVPDGEGFRNLVERWRYRPLIERVGIRFVMVGPTGAVSGFPRE